MKKGMFTAGAHSILQIDVHNDHIYVNDVSYSSPVDDCINYSQIFDGRDMIIG